MHCWFDFEDSYWTDNDEHVPGHTCMLDDGHDGPHEPTSDDEIVIAFEEAG